MIIIYKIDTVEAVMCWKPSSNRYKLKEKLKNHIQ